MTARNAIVIFFALALNMVALALPGWIAIDLCFGEWVPGSTIERLPGATKAEVRELLGEPTSAFADPEFERWEYRPVFRTAEFRVDFARDGRVQDWSYDR